MYIFIFHFLHILILTFTAVYTMHITNLSPIQRISVVDKFKKKIQEQAKENQSLGGGDKKSENAKNRVSPNGEKRSVTHTDKELAKMAGVGTGTIARYNRVMNSDNEELKKEVLSGEIGGSAKKVGKRIKELERLYGIQNGSTSFQGNQYEVVTNKSEAPKKTQEQLAAQMGISVDTLQNYKMLSEMIPELSDLVDTGIVTKTTALAIISLLDNNRNS